MKRLIDDAYAKAETLILAHKDKLDIIAKALLEYETLDGQHIKEIMEHGRILNPPQSPKPPSPPPVTTVQPERPAAKPDEQSDDGLPGGVVGVPA